MTLKTIITNKKYLFLDRDGVINQRVWGGYITDWNDFHFVEGAIEAICQFSRYFERIIIVTNQQGIGKNLMTANDVELIHENLSKTIHQSGGRIDAIYYCGDLKTKEPNCRKPNPHMALKAQSDFPEIDFNKTLMVGDTKSDMEFAKNCGMTGILVKTHHTTNEDLSSCKYSIYTLNELSNLLK